jgi:hypothetical protein
MTWTCLVPGLVFAVLIFFHTMPTVPRRPAIVRAVIVVALMVPALILNLLRLYYKTGDVPLGLVATSAVLPINAVWTLIHTISTLVYIYYPHRTLDTVISIAVGSDSPLCKAMLLTTTTSFCEFQKFLRISWQKSTNFTEVLESKYRSV